MQQLTSVDIPDNNMTISKSYKYKQKLFKDLTPGKFTVAGKWKFSWIAKVWRHKQEKLMNMFFQFPLLFTNNFIVYGHMTSNNETVSRQMPWEGKIAKTMTSNVKQFTVSREMLTAVARDQRWPDVVAGISARFAKFAI